MTISDKTRKVLWGRSGNKCAICKHTLVIDATVQNDEAVVGDECHIISPQPNGPRHDPSVPSEDLDSYDNLILLCRVHHKMIDDQKDTYGPDVLALIKINHEKWVTERLSPSSEPKPIRLRRIKNNIPQNLPCLTSGKQILDLVVNSYSSSFDHDEPHDDQEVDLVGGFLQAVHDWAEMGFDLEPSDLVKAAYELTQMLNQLDESGFAVFGAKEVQVLEGGVGNPSPWPTTILRVIRKTNLSISTMNQADSK
ncbi:MAG TPA: HNH endonuclease [Verrucomicrobia bacterium]|nr:HNH endonuclease [Verrucomicrobiota bacterium]